MRGRLHAAAAPPPPPAVNVPKGPLSVRSAGLSAIQPGRCTSFRYTTVFSGEEDDDDDEEDEAFESWSSSKTPTQKIHISNHCEASGATTEERSRVPFTAPEVRVCRKFTGLVVAVAVVVVVLLVLLLLVDEEEDDEEVSVVVARVERSTSTTSSVQPRSEPEFMFGELVHRCVCTVSLVVVARSSETTQSSESRKREHKERAQREK